MKFLRKNFPEVVSNSQHFSLADRKSKLQLDNTSELELLNIRESKGIFFRLGLFFIYFVFFQSRWHNTYKSKLLQISTKYKKNIKRKESKKENELEYRKENGFLKHVKAFT